MKHILCKDGSKEMLIEVQIVHGMQTSKVLGTKSREGFWEREQFSGYVSGDCYDDYTGKEYRVLDKEEVTALILGMR